MLRTQMVRSLQEHAVVERTFSSCLDLVDPFQHSRHWLVEDQIHHRLVDAEAVVEQIQCHQLHWAAEVVQSLRLLVVEVAV